MNKNEGSNLENTSPNGVAGNKYSSYSENITDDVVKNSKKSPNKFVIIIVVVLAAVFAALIFIGRNRDVDGDGLTSAEEKTAGTDVANVDTDGDTLSDYYEVKEVKTNPKSKDTDEDGVADDYEVNNSGTNPTKADTDEDGLMDGEAVEYGTDPLVADTDGDGLLDGEEVNDYGTEPTKLDTDSDNLSDGEEVNDYSTDPLTTDTDGDYLLDGEEVNGYGSDPLTPDYEEATGLAANFEQYEEGYVEEESGVIDSDGDNLIDDEEILNYDTDPYKADTDGDGVNDGVEIHEGTGDDESFYLENGTYTVTTTADVCEIEYGIYDRSEYVVRSGEPIEITVDGSNDIFETVWYTLPVGETVTFTPVLD